VSDVGHDYINNLVNTSSLIEGSVHVVNRDQLGLLAGWKLGLGDKILVNEVSSGLVSTMASVDDSSMVSVVFKWIWSMMDFGPSSRERMMSFRFIRFSHLGWRGLRGSVGRSVSVSDSCVSLSIFGSVISRTEN